MKKIKQLSFIIIAALLTLSSCTMQKRIYNRGFHIEWLEGHGSEKVATTQAKKAEKKKGVKTEQNEETIASN
ncbi:MAG: hypothetical protein PSX81_07295 [bacterium]|nr:hypothetical protein [bacterium]